MNLMYPVCNSTNTKYVDYSNSEAPTCRKKSLYILYKYNCGMHPTKMKYVDYFN